MANNFYERYQTVFIVSEINEDIVVKNINFEKQMIADMDEDVQEIIRKISEQTLSKKPVN